MDRDFEATLEGVPSAIDELERLARERDQLAAVAPRAPISRDPRTLAGELARLRLGEIEVENPDVAACLAPFARTWASARTYNDVRRALGELCRPLLLKEEDLAAQRAANESASIRIAAVESVGRLLDELAVRESDTKPG